MDEFREQRYAANAALAQAVKQVVAEVRNAWPEASAPDAVAYAHETVTFDSLDEGSPTYLAYLVFLGAAFENVRYQARKIDADEQASRAAEFEDGVRVLTPGGRTGRVRGKAQHTPTGWVVTVDYDTVGSARWDVRDLIRR